MAAPDPFDPASLRLSQDFAQSLGIKKVITNVPVRRPDKQTFVRVHPSVDMRIETAIVELKEEGEHYLIAPTMAAELSGEIVPKLLLTAITRQGSIFLWPIRLPDATGRLDEWSRSAAEVAKIAETRWTRVVSNRDVGAYEALIATSEIEDPKWPELAMNEILRLAFRERFVDRPDHPLISRLRGRR